MFLFLKQIYDAPSLLFSGIHVHIGSQIKDPERYQKAMSECAEFLYKHRAAIQAEVVFDAGGGFFSPYAGDEVDHELKNFLENQFDIRLENLLISKDSSIHHLESGMKNLVIQKKQEIIEKILKQFNN